MAAQSVITGSVDDINAINIQQDKYVFAEFTDKSESIAVDNVKSLLGDQIDYWVSMNVGKDAPIVRDAKIIILKRGSYFRAFAYVETDKNPALVETAPSPAVVKKLENKETVEKPVVVPQEPMSGGPLSGVRTFDQVKPFIEALDEKGLLIDYGKFTTLPETGNCYILVYDRNGAIAARLKRENRELQNLDTDRLDSFSNYPGCGATWFRTFNGKLN